MTHDRQLFWSRGGLLSLSACPVCEEPISKSKKYCRRDDFGFMQDEWVLLRCSKCASIYLNPRPDDASLPRAYQDYFTHDESADPPPLSIVGRFIQRMINGYLNKTFFMNRKPANSLGFIVFSLLPPLRLKLDYYGRHLYRKKFRTKGSLLDVGCGSGEFLKVAEEMGWQAVGCEPDERAAAVCRRFGLNVISGSVFDERLNNKSFDIITLSHVLEHVSEQNVFLQRLYGLLNPGGCMWIALPNPESFGSNVFSDAWKGLHPPYHLVIPSQNVLVSMLQKAGFNEVKLVRRGQHTKRQWAESLAISKRYNINYAKCRRLYFLRALVDVASSISPRSSDETVVMAYKRSSYDG